MINIANITRLILFLIIVILGYLYISVSNEYGNYKIEMEQNHSKYIEELLAQKEAEIIAENEATREAVESQAQQRYEAEKTIEKLQKDIEKYKGDCKNEKIDLSRYRL